MINLRIGQKLALCLISLLINNVITFLTVGSDTNIYITVALIGAVSIPLFFIKPEIPETIVSWITLGLAVVFMVYDSISSFNGFILFLFSITINKKSKVIFIIYGMAFLTSMVLSYNINKHAPSRMMGFISGLTFVGVFYYHYVYSKGIKYKISEKNDVNNTIGLYLQGYNWDQIAVKLALNITGKSLQRKVKKEYETLGFNNLAQYAHFLSQKGKITIVDKNQITR